jgi:hypothetical protein
MKLGRGGGRKICKILFWQILTNREGMEELSADWRLILIRISKK